MPLTYEAENKTAFTTPNETGQFERMTFGLTNAPSVSQLLMNPMLGPLRGKVAMCCLDDVRIPAENWERLAQRLQQVLGAFSKANLTLRLSKCSFARDNADFLGFRLTKGGVQPGEVKVRKFQSSRCRKVSMMLDIFGVNELV